MSKISLLKEIKKYPCLPKIQAIFASELIRRTKREGFLKTSTATLAKNMGYNESTLKNTISYFKAQGWLQAKKKPQNQKAYNYKATQALLDFIAKKIAERNEHTFATFNRITISEENKNKILGRTQKTKNSLNLNHKN